MANTIEQMDENARLAHIYGGRGWFTELKDSIPTTHEEITLTVCTGKYYVSCPLLYLDHFTTLLVLHFIHSINSAYSR